MDTRRRYLAGDIYFLEDVNKIVPRRMELPLFMHSTAEPRQVIRALRQRDRPPALKIPLKITKIDRSLVDTSTAWKLPPNVYHLDDFTTQRRQMGRRGPFQCFTVERDDKTVRNHHAPKPDGERCETDFYDIRTPQSDAHKSKFLQAARFAELKIDGTPPPTKYFPQNFAIKPTVRAACCNRGKFRAKAVEDDPVFYYPHTTVPEHEMKFNKAAVAPEPGRYDPHYLTCRCRVKKSEKNIFSRGVKVVEEGKEEGVEGVEGKDGEEKKPQKKKVLEVKFDHFEREPISFRVRRSKSLEDVSTSPSGGCKIRFNTMIRKKNLFSTKTGRPVGFLSAAPRFEETAEKPVKLHEKASRERAEETAAAAESKPKATKGLTEKRLKELATPKQAQAPKVKTERIQVFAKLPPPSLKTFAEKLRVMHKVSAFSFFGLKRVRERSLREAEVSEEDLVDDSQLSQIVVSS